MRTNWDGIIAGKIFQTDATNSAVRTPNNIGVSFSSGNPDSELLKIYEGDD